MFTKIGTIGAMSLIWENLDHKLDNARKNGKKLRSLKISLSCWINKLSMFPDLYIYESQLILFNIYVTFTVFFFVVVTWKIKIHYCICRRPGFDSWVRKISWRREWQPTPYSFLQNPMDKRSLSVHSVAESDTTVWTIVHSVAESDTTEQITHHFSFVHTRPFALFLLVQVCWKLITLFFFIWKCE